MHSGCIFRKTEETDLQHALSTTLHRGRERRRLTVCRGGSFQIDTVCWTVQMQLLVWKRAVTNQTTTQNLLSGRGKHESQICLETKHNRTSRWVRRATASATGLADIEEVDEFERTCDKKTGYVHDRDGLDDTRHPSAFEGLY